MHLRLEMAKDLDLLNKNVYKFLWVTEFPEFEYSEEQEDSLQCTIRSLCL